MTFHSIRGLTSCSCVGRVELYQVPKYLDVSRNYEQYPELGLGGEYTDLNHKLILDFQE